MTEWLTLLSEHRFLESRDFLHFIHSKSSVFKTVAHKRHLIHMGLLRWLSGQESACRCRRHGFDPWVGRILWRRKWQSTPVFLPGESHGRRSLVCYSPRGRKESDTTERLHFHFHFVAQLVKNLPAMPETWVGSLGWEDPLEKRKVTHSSILAWRSPWTV